MISIRNLSILYECNLFYKCKIKKKALEDTTSVTTACNYYTATQLAVGVVQIPFKMCSQLVSNLFAGLILALRSKRRIVLLWDPEEAAFFPLCDVGE